MLFGRRKLGYYVLAIPIFIVLLYFWRSASEFEASRLYEGAGSSASSSTTSPKEETDAPTGPWAGYQPQYGSDEDANFLWRTLPVQNPVESLRPLPTGKPLKLPPIQIKLPPEAQAAKAVRLERQAAVAVAFRRCWESYRQRAWGSDELTPVSGGARNWFGGWGATLVDSLDTLWIMGMKPEFKEAVEAVAKIDFSNTSSTEINVFETNIRYLGGLLAAHDLSGERVLLVKAREVGDLLLAAFDTPNRMPITRWKLHRRAEGKEKQVADENVLVAEIGSLSMELTRLSLLTKDPRYFDASQRVMDAMAAQQGKTAVPGMWPVVVNARTKEFNYPGTYTLGAMADSAFEYLPKMYALVGGLLPMYEKMYLWAMDAAAKHNFYRPMVPDGEDGVSRDLLLSGNVQAKFEDGKTLSELEPQGQHLVCFAGGMLALGGKLFGNQDHLDLARKLVDGCVWTYKALPLGIMPESFSMVPCKDPAACPWDEAEWRRGILKQANYPADKTPASKADEIIDKQRLPKGFSAIPDARYILRPEAIESVFVLYRATGRHDLVEDAWRMWQAIDGATKTTLANSAIADVTVLGEGAEGQVQQTDSMESFWLGETLKYFYLIFSEPSLISLDEYVFNTEAHPLKRML